MVEDAATVRLCPFHDTITLAPPPAASSSASNGSPAPAAVVPQGEVVVGVTRAQGGKCARCWNYSPAVGAHEAALAAGFSDLCERCFPVVQRLGFKLPDAAAPAASAQAAVPVGAGSS